MSREIKHLSPFMQGIAKEFLEECREADLDIVIICTYRSDHDQAMAFARRASNAKPGQSAHNVTSKDNTPASEAFDVGVIRNGKYIGNGEDKDYKAAGLIGERLGLSWAGRWKGTLLETGHFQNPNWGRRRHEGQRREEK